MRSTIGSLPKLCLEVGVLALQKLDLFAKALVRQIAFTWCLDGIGLVEIRPPVPARIMQTMQRTVQAAKVDGSLKRESCRILREQLDNVAQLKPLRTFLCPESPYVFELSRIPVCVSTLQ